MTNLIKLEADTINLNNNIISFINIYNDKELEANNNKKLSNFIQENLSILKNYDASISKINFLNYLYHSYFLNENDIYFTLRSNTINNEYFKILKNINKNIKIKEDIIKLEKEIILNNKENDSYKYSTLRNSLSDNYNKLKSSYLIKLYEYGFYNLNNILIKEKDYNKAKKILSHISECNEKATQLKILFINLLINIFEANIKIYFNNYNCYYIHCYIKYYFNYVYKCLKKINKFNYFDINADLKQIIIIIFSHLKHNFMNYFENIINIDELFIIICNTLSLNLYFNNILKNESYQNIDIIHKYNIFIFDKVLIKLKSYEDQYNYINKNINKENFIYEFSNYLEINLLTKHYLLLDTTNKTIIQNLKYISLFIKYYIEILNKFDTINLKILFKIQNIINLLKQYKFDDISLNNSQLEKILIKYNKYIISIIEKEYNVKNININLLVDKYNLNEFQNKFLNNIFN